MRLAARRTSAREHGQAALMLVLGITLLLVTCGGMLAINSVAHDPLLQSDAAEHYAYRALEAGMNTYLSTINAQPDLVDCSSISVASTCTNTVNGIKYDTWTMVQGTTQSAGNVPEYYLWTNPQLCFSKTKATDTACTAKPTRSHGNFEYLQVEIVGAAGYSGHFAYQSTVANFSSGQGFLTRVWWSDFEATDLSVSKPTTDCHYDWTPTKSPYTGDGSCGTVFFGPGDVVDGPVYTNDSIYVVTRPVFGTPTTRTVDSPVSTADPNCLFVDPGSTGRQQTKGPPKCKTVDTADVSRYTTTNSHYAQKKEPIPTKDTTLEILANLNGCVYSGPTTISFYEKSKTQYMNVFSPETPVKTGKDEDNASTNTRQCTGKTPGKIWSTVPAPTAAHTGNGVIYVANSTKGTDGVGTCSGNGDNPLDGKIQHKMTSNVPTHASASAPTKIEDQVVAAGTFSGTNSGYDYAAGETAGTDDCAGDAFVRDATSHPSGSVTGIAGNLTVTAQHNIDITGDLEYTDCGSAFASGGYERTCSYNAGTVNDSLGLIATDFVEVNRPGNPQCKNSTKRTVTTTSCTHPSPSTLLPTCSSTVTPLTAVLCNPGPNVVIDAAILALKQSFTVNDYKVSPATTRLYVYGTVDQKFRGPVGTFSNNHISTGYSKYYVWDSRLQYVSIPHYLTPATPSWELSSSSVVMSTSCPGWPKAYLTGSTPTKAPATRLFPAATTIGPTGAKGAC